MSEQLAITSVIEQYIDGGVKGDASLMRPAFHEDATIYSVVDGRGEGEVRSRSCSTGSTGSQPRT